MLNIPIEVQDALRAGDRRKNYKMKVNNVVPVRSVVDIASLTSNDPSISLDAGTYILYNTESTRACDEIILNGASSRGYTIPDGSTETWFEFEVYEATMTLTVYGFNAETVYLTIPDNVSYTYNREYVFTIDNDTLVAESVKIDERMVTGKELKFGLCEGSSLEFQYFDHPNINGKDVQVYCSVEYIDGNGDVAWYDIPMGWYTVDQCPRQWSTGIYKVTAYNKLKSDYLDQKANNTVMEMVSEGEPGFPGTISLYKLLNELLNKYKIETADTEISTGVADSSVTDTYTIYADSQTSMSMLDMRVAFNNSPLQADEYYKFALYAKRTFEYIADYYNYRNRTVTPSPGNTMTLYDFCFSDYTDAEYWSGCLSIDTGSEYIFHKSFAEWSQEESAEIVETEYYTNPEAPLIVEISLPRYIFDDCFQETGIVVSHLLLSDIEKYRLTEAEIEGISDITIRELQSAVYEIICQYGQLDRETDLFSGVELNQGGLYPATNLYPSDSLYPSGPGYHPFPSTYQKLWTDTVGEQSFRYLIITYKGTETVNGQTQEVEKVLQRTVNADGTTDYNMSDNWLFKNLVWSDADVGDYADAMVLKMQNIKWFPFELWSVGLPFVETGDAIEITDKQGDTYTSYVLTRTLDGVQNLKDTFINGELDIF